METDFTSVPATFFRKGETTISQPILIGLTLIIVFIATLTHATFGFGTALVAMPLLVLTVGVQTATPLVAFVIVTITLIIVWSSWRSIEFRATWRLLLSSAAGIPLGLLVLKSAPVPNSTIVFRPIASSGYSMGS
jgi:uncharacterized membrane protein YfcA